MYLTHNNFFYPKLLAIAIIIFGARLWFIHNFGSSVPYWDQWDGEAAGVFLPWLNGTLTVTDLFTPHNEHRIVFTRLLSLVLLILNDRQWDPLLEMVVNAFLSTLTAIFLIVILHKLLGAALQNLIFFSIALLWTLPYAWENILGGFHSCWYFFNLFTLLAFWGVLLHRHFTWQWWVGILSGLLAYFNLATGFFALLVIVVIKLYLLIIDTENRKSQIPTLLLSSIIVITCILLTVNMPTYSVTMAHGADKSQFWQAFGTALAWPWVLPGKWLGLLTYLPFFILVIHTIRWRRHPSPAELLVLALGGWTLLQAASMSYARTGLLTPAFRYMDILALGTLANLLAIYFITPTWKNWPTGVKFVANTLACFWILLWSLGIINLTTTIWPVIEKKHIDSTEELKNTRNFLLSGDMNSLKHKIIPYPIPERLAGLLVNPQLRRILPHTLAVPKLLESSQKEDSPFVLDGFYPTTGNYQGEKTLGSYNSLGNPAVGKFMSKPIHKLAKSFIEIPVAGYLGEKDLILQLVVAGQDKPISIIPPALSKETWVSYYVRTPDRPFQVVAIDNRTDLWFAFAMPRGIGILSFGVIWLLQQGKILFFAGLFLIGWLFCTNWKYFSRSHALRGNAA
jgi:hypothetical protein